MLLVSGERWPQLRFKSPPISSPHRKLDEPGNGRCALRYVAGGLRFMLPTPLPPPARFYDVDAPPFSAYAARDGGGG